MYPSVRTRLSDGLLVLLRVGRRGERPAFALLVHAPVPAIAHRIPASLRASATIPDLVPRRRATRCA